MSQRIRSAGFTLIELMIVVAIVAILASIAWPSYASAMRRLHRASAQAFISEVASKQALRLSDARAYAGSLSALGVAVPDAVTAHYTVSVTADDTPSFVVTATPIGNQVPDGNLSIASNGQKLPPDKW